MPEVPLNRSVVMARIAMLEKKRKEAKAQMMIINLALADAYDDLADSDPHKSDMMDYVKDGFNGRAFDGKSFGR